ncbi:thioesterase family protein [Streptomyces sp. H27-D2]|uniref:thioesterase family protein n=1 Tax=Streptomyces sp. H27-D2 TaxID=3046304 RepID=UPI002DB9056F|nr:thioesterase family protein [Streptomyces sp. H27-D2]MEC4019558.1 thioesterase family protein [Streptomyces sp. H27-D2]
MTQTAEAAQPAETTGTAVGLPVFREAVREDWLDYNGHLSEAFYVLVFGYATDAMMVRIGLGGAYREQSGCSLYTVEAHVRYLREVGSGAELAIRTRILGTDSKKVRFVHEMFVGDAVNDPEGEPVATEELFALHVDKQGGHATPLPPEVQQLLAAATAPGPAPEWAGRGIRTV